MKEEFEYTIFTDGGSRGNPGEAAYGFVIYDANGEKIYGEGKRLGIQTNNFAEYTGVIESLSWLKENRNANGNVLVTMDSQLAVMQLSGKWKIKSESIRDLFYTVKKLEHDFSGRVFYKHILREGNKEADRYVNLALDQKI